MSRTVPAPSAPLRAGRRRPLVSWPLYRLVLALALLVGVAAGVTMSEPVAPDDPVRPAEFDGAAAANLAANFIHAGRGRRCCAPGSAGAIAQADWVAEQLRRAGLRARVRPFAADLPWESGPVSMTNVLAYRPGRQRGTIALIAHRDGGGAASATAVMLELARELGRADRQRGLVFLSTDGGSTGGQGAAEFARTFARTHPVEAAVVLDALSAPPGTRFSLLLRPDLPRGTSPTLVAALRRETSTWAGRSAHLPSVLDQLLGYAVPYTRGEQGPLLAADVPAVTLTASPGTRRVEDVEELGPNEPELQRAGLAAANVLTALDAAPRLDTGGPASLFIARRVLRGVLAQATVAALMAPVVACVLDMVARVRRRGVPLAGALGALGWRCLNWLVVLLGLWILARAPGRLVSGVAIAPQAGRTGVTVAGLVLAALVPLLFWRFVVQPRLVPLARVSAVERTAGLAAALLGLCGAAVLLTAVNPFALVLVLPAAHAWLWLPRAARLGRRGMLAVYLVGLLGPLLLVADLWWGQGLHGDTPAALVAMTASGYLPPPVAICLALVCACGAQLGALLAGRYAPAHRRALDAPLGRLFPHGGGGPPP